MTKIEWTEKTWNPVVGCSVISPGCANCYAMKMAARLEAMSDGKHAAIAGQRGLGLSQYAGLTKTVKGKAVWTGKVAIVDDYALTAPLRRKKPTTYFVNSMGDLFHEDVPDEWIDRVFAVTALCPQHTFQILTKRAKRIRLYLGSCKTDGVCYYINRLLGRSSEQENATYAEWRERIRAPLTNVWLGVSCENQANADERIPELLATPAAVRFVSCEPLLGPVNLGWLDFGGHQKLNALAGVAVWSDGTYHDEEYTKLDWVICGGESGHGARPMHPEWARGLRDQCLGSGVPFFFKQHGNWSEVYDRNRDDPDWRKCPEAKNDSERYVNLAGGYGFHGDHVLFMRNVGKKRSGRLLDGRTWDEMPDRG